MEYIAEVYKTKDMLPPQGIYVLVHLTKDNWISIDMEGVYWVVAQLVEGISIKQRERMPECERKITYVDGDEHCNNKAPYSWNTFGSSSFFGQEVDKWMHLPHNMKIYEGK